MALLGKFKESVKNVFGHSSHDFWRVQERQLVLQAQVLAKANRKLKILSDLSDVEFSAFSQWGEDGVIDWLASCLPEMPQNFIEFGVEDYREANTRLLLQLRNWNGLIIDSSQKKIQDIRRQEIYWRHSLTANCALVDIDNINILFKNVGLEGEIGLLSIDIDGNDYWVWQAIESVSPVIVVAEYNAVLGDLHALTVPYRSEFQRTQAHYSNLYFGASLPALIHLGQSKGYTFIGTVSSGCNAFFIKNEFASQVTSSLSGAWGYPSKFREARNQSGNPLFLEGSARADLIADSPLVNTLTGAETCLREFSELYSEFWKANSRVIF